MLGVCSMFRALGATKCLCSRHRAVGSWTPWGTVIRLTHRKALQYLMMVLSSSWRVFWTRESSPLTSPRTCTRPPRWAMAPQASRGGRASGRWRAVGRWTLTTSSRRKRWTHRATPRGEEETRAGRWGADTWSNCMGPKDSPFSVRVASSRSRPTTTTRCCFSTRRRAHSKRRSRHPTRSECPAPWGSPTRRGPATRKTGSGRGSGRARAANRAEGASW
mmetsp:Transcript_22745/g.51291  ORF Transcript_22745/g.51291 Transcript_22745/m.51291 type:complete len:219 (-) Transcript_22745:703-1359(-)